jgi:hypothetical protein
MDLKVHRMCASRLRNLPHFSSKFNKCRCHWSPTKKQSARMNGYLLSSDHTPVYERLPPHAHNFIYKKLDANEGMPSTQYGCHTEHKG